MPPFALSVPYRQQYLQRMELAMNYVEQHLAEPLDLATIAQAANFSPYHFHRIFKALTGENPQDYINRLRLERAANLLIKSPARSITDIALSCGFSSSSAFSRSFKKHFGVSARDYARQPAPATLQPSMAEPEDPALGLPSVSVKKAGPLHLAYVASRHGYSPASTTAAWVKLFQWVNARQLLTPETRLVGISFDDPDITPRQRCRYFACMSMPPEQKGDTIVSIFDFPEHLCAVARITCPGVPQIQQAYRLLYRAWLPDSGFFMADLPPYEIIYDAPDVTPGGQYVFDLCLPITVL